MPHTISSCLKWNLDKTVQELGFQQLKPRWFEALEAFVVHGNIMLVAVHTGYVVFNQIMIKYFIGDHKKNRAT